MRGNLLHAYLAALFWASSLHGAARFTVVVVDPPGIGFNDRTPAQPVGGNNGATVGEQRLNALRQAAAIWGGKLDSAVPIRIRASYERVQCSVDNAIAGAAQPTEVYTLSFANSEILPNTWYPVALANKLLEKTIDPNTEEIEILFNPDIGKADCLPGWTWYYGLDNQAPQNSANMVTIALHELAHGLGFFAITNPDNTRLEGRGDVYSQYVVDTSVQRTWNQLTDQQRITSASNTSHVVWNGINVHKDAPKVLLPGAAWLRVLEPSSIAGDRTVGTAEFGPAIVPPGLSGELVLAASLVNGDGSSATDGCSPLSNTAEAAGRIVMADRGGCDFTQKAENAQAAGAIGLVVVNNVEGSLPRELGGTDPAVIIPVVHVSLADGKTLKAALAKHQTVKVMLAADANVLRGADYLGRPMLLASDTGDSLSLISHWDARATPNQLMEPDLRPDTKQEVDPPYDLTLSLFRDLGWFSDFDGVPDGIDQCPGSDQGASLRIQGCDTGVRNTTFSTGCRMSDYYKNCDGQTGADFTACVDVVSRRYVDTNIIGAAEANKIQACAVASAK